MASPVRVLYLCTGIIMHVENEIKLGIYVRSIPILHIVRYSSADIVLSLDVRRIENPGAVMYVEIMDQTEAPLIDCRHSDPIAFFSDSQILGYRTCCGTIRPYPQGGRTCVDMRPSKNGVPSVIYCSLL